MLQVAALNANSLECLSIQPEGAFKITRLLNGWSVYSV